MAGTAATESQIRALIDAVDRADQAGDRGEAERALARAEPQRRTTRACSMPPECARCSAATRSGSRPARAGRGARRGKPDALAHLALAHRELKDDSASATLSSGRSSPIRVSSRPAAEGTALRAAGKAEAGRVHVPRFSLLRSRRPASAGSEIGDRARRRDLKKNDAASNVLRPRVDERARARRRAARALRRLLRHARRQAQVFAPQPTFMLYPRCRRSNSSTRALCLASAFEPRRTRFARGARTLAQAADGFVPYISKPAGSRRSVAGAQQLEALEHLLPVEERRARRGAPRALPQDGRLLEAAPLCEIRGHAPPFLLGARAETRIPRTPA